MTNNTNTQSDVLMVTQEGLDQMHQELADRRIKEQEIAEEIDEARKLGDLKENDPYKNAMQKKEMNDTRIDELTYMISVAQVVESDKNGSIGIGNTVDMIDVKNDKPKRLSLVGRQESQEADPREGKVSIDSPIGMAIIGKKKGDTVVVTSPNGEVEYKITKVA